MFPDLESANPGGVQVSAQLAWEMLQRETEARSLIVRNRFDGITAARSARFRPDVLLFWHIDLLRLAPVMRTRARRVLFLHGIESWRPHRWLMRRLLKQTQLIANSHYTVQRATPFIPSAADPSTQVVHLGVGAPRATAQPHPTVRAALMIGRMDTGEGYKGHHEAIRAWPNVLQQIPGAQLWIAGDGSLRPELEALAEQLGLGNAVHFHGRVTEIEKQALLDAARCLVLPSRAEGFGLVYIEAMRAGRPCLVGVDAGREVVNPPEAGWSADPSDARALVHAICSLLSNDAQWHQQSRAARARYETQFTAPHFQRRLLEALKRIQ